MKMIPRWKSSFGLKSFSDYLFLSYLQWSAMNCDITNEEKCNKGGWDGPAGRFLGVSTPRYKKTILESKQPVSGIDFFFRFSPRLSKNYYSQVKFIAKFVPTASKLRYFGLNCCVFPVKSVVRGHEQVGYERELLIFLEKHSNLGQNNANLKL